MNKLTGIGILIVSTLLYSTLHPILKKVSKDIPPFTSMTVTMLVLFLVSFVMSLLFERSALMKLPEQRSALLLLVLFGLINAIAFWLLINGYKYMPVWQVTMFGVAIPILSGIMAYFMLGETLSPNLFIGLIIAGIGLFIAIK